jgi:hypothetical protein
LGVASDDITVDKLVKRARETMVDTDEEMDDEIFDRLARLTSRFLPRPGPRPPLDNPGKVQHCDPGSWGPDAAQALLRSHRGWQQPWLGDNSRASR